MTRKPTRDMRPLEERIHDYTVVGECWIWNGYRKPDSGHAVVSSHGRPHLVHRLQWIALNGPVPPGRILHHTCETPACVRPDHLRPVTRAEHAALHRRSTCRRGHDLAQPRARDGFGHCRACKNEDARARYRARTHAH